MRPICCIAHTRTVPGRPDPDEWRRGLMVGGSWGCGVVVPGVGYMFPRGKRCDHMKHPWRSRGDRRASFGGEGAGRFRGVSSLLCYRRTWHSVGMCSHRAARDVSGVSWWILLESKSKKGESRNLLHFTAKPCTLGTDSTLEPVLFFVGGLNSR